jgi:NADP-dependent 3-hydroxy acid dehydrogenase YdfG
MKTGFVVITGASSSIGEATAQLFIAKGHNVLLLSRREDRLKAFAGRQVMKAIIDITDRPALDQAITEAEEHFGPVKGIVNNAGRMLLGDITTQDPAEWQEMYNTNVIGLLNGMQAVLPSMIEQKSGTIINISSIAGKKTFADHVAYGGTKFAVHSISENVREEVAPHNVRVVTISPGLIETEWNDQTTGEKAKLNLMPQTIADTIYFAFSQPQSINIREIALAPTQQQS